MAIATFNTATGDGYELIGLVVLVGGPLVFVAVWTAVAGRRASTRLRVAATAVAVAVTAWHLFIGLEGDVAPFAVPVLALVAGLGRTRSTPLRAAAVAVWLLLWPGVTLLAQA